MQKLEGGCACGATRYKLTDQPLIVHACHCRDCQRITAGPFVINLWIETKFVDADHHAPKSFTLKGGMVAAGPRSSGTRMPKAMKRWS